MQGLQRRQADRQLADVLGSFCDCQNNLSAVGEHVGGARTDVQVREVRLATRESGEQPVKKTFVYTPHCTPIISLIS